VLLSLMPSAVRNGNHQIASRLLIDGRRQLALVGGPNRASGKNVAHGARYTLYWRCVVAPLRDTPYASLGIRLRKTFSHCVNPSTSRFAAVERLGKVSRNDATTQRAALADAKCRAQRQSSDRFAPVD
jgi:hypothetical protein